jgi:alkylated DNA repair dioxygenase AlkB
LYCRYRDGRDYIAEHRDDEKDLDPSVPIASLSLGQARDFVYKHRDARKRGPQKREIASGVKISYAILALLLPSLHNQALDFHAVIITVK